MKNYIKFPLVLGLISACSGLLIGGVYMLVNPTIVNNQNATELAARQEVFAEATAFDKIERDFSDCTYLKEVYAATNEDGLLGYLYRGEGANSYGAISLYAGIIPDEVGTLKTVSLLENTQSYASIVNDWVNVTFLAPIDDTNSIDVSCGATRGATIVKNIVLEAQADYLKGGF